MERETNEMVACNGANDEHVHENYYNLELQLNAIYANKSTENSHKKKYTQICDKTWVMPKFHLENFTQKTIHT